MDRRNFLSQSFVTMGTYAISFSSFATMDFKGNASVSLRPGLISQKEFEVAAHNAETNRRMLVLHPNTKVNISTNLDITCSIVGNGGTINISKGARLNFVGEKSSSIKVSSVKFQGEVVFSHEGKVKISQNDFVNNYGDALTLDTNASFEVFDNKISSTTHGIVVLRNNKGSITSNTVEVNGDEGHYVWAENSFNLVVENNTFSHSTTGNPSLGIANDHDLNPNLTLRNNRIA